MHVFNFLIFGVQSWVVQTVHAASPNGPPGSNVFDIFDVDQSCVSRDLQKLVNEATEMAYAGSLIVNQGATGQSLPGVAYLYGLFGAAAAPDDEGTRPKDFSTLQTCFQRTLNFLAYGVQPSGNVFNGKTVKPRLYCDDSSFQHQARQAQATQLDGQLATDGNGDPLSIELVYSSDFLDFIEKNAAFPEPHLVNIPQTSDHPAFSQYIFTDRAQLCAPGRYGQTFRAQTHSGGENPVPIILLCPDCFSYGNSPSLGFSAPTYVGQSLDDFLPKGTNTFLHELFHFAPWWPSANAIFTGDPAYPQKDDLAGVTTLLYDKASTNAQSYVYFGLAAWYSLYKPANINGQSQTLVFNNGYGEILYEGP
ncbi:Hypothetical protein R9X50_00469400 [Acrodontium crateriforme]|uniref:Lysine-specific metallo-endopeptidase domain-containing protein n=1 Tax=Acrodontium crateriforme TaxID=150365 RepID=A0AAQ3M5T3_9PEZI|nr:Hypothetical protein R9X50_00469400 [Acrodontium crateriforme]